MGAAQGKMSGRVTVAGRDVTGLPTHEIVRAGISYVPQVQNVFPVAHHRREPWRWGAYIHAGRIRGPGRERPRPRSPDLAARAA